MSQFLVLWAFLGVLFYLITVCLMSRWHSTIWQQIDTYIMIVPCIVAGPFIGIFVLYELMEGEP